MRWTGVLILPALLFSHDLRITGKLYLSYHRILAPEEEAGYNTFDLRRFYITLRGNLTPPEAIRKVQYRITLDAQDFFDVARKGDVEDLSKVNGYFLSFIKYAYVELEGFLPHIRIRFGQHPTPWVGYEESLWGFRWIQKVLPDEAGYMSSADRGLSLLASLPEDLLELHLSVVNGEGYHRSEPNRYKDFMARLTVAPFPWIPAFSGLQAHLYIGQGTPAAGEVRYRTLGALSYKTNALRLMGAMFFFEDGPSPVSTKGRGISAHGSLDLGTLQRKGSWGVLARYDRLDPDRGKVNDGWGRLLLGLFLRISPGLHIALDYDIKHYEDGTIWGELALHTRLKF